MGMWQVNQARDRFSDLLDEAETHGPQIITRHGANRAVVLSFQEYERLHRKKPDLKHVLLHGPKIDDIDITRNPDRGRDIDL